MPYITKYNQDRILEKGRSEIRDDLKEQLYSRPIYLFNRLEKSKLLDYRDFCEGKMDFGSDFKKAEIIDRGEFVWEGAQPSYHNDETCERLNSNFKNITLPQEIKDAGKAKIEEFRNWFKAHLSPESPDELIIEKVRDKYGIVYKPEKVNFKNSGSIFKETLNVRQIERRLNSLLALQRMFYRRFQTEVGRFSKATFLAFKDEPISDNDTRWNDDELKSFLRYYHNAYKVPLEYYIKEYYRIKNGKDVSFSDTFLIELGFKACGNCAGNNSATSSPKPEVKVLSAGAQELDDFLKSRGVNYLARFPADVKEIPTEDPNAFDLYFFAKILSIRDNDEFHDANEPFMIEAIAEDKIGYYPAQFDPGHRDMTYRDLSVFGGYLVHLKLEKDPRRVGFTVFPYTYQEGLQAATPGRRS